MLRRRGIVVLALLAVTAAACGTRLTDDEFLAAANLGPGAEGGGGTTTNGVVGGTETGGLVDGQVAGPGGGSTTRTVRQGGGGGTSGGTEGSGGGGGGGGGGSVPGGCGGNNTASDVGITPTSIKVGNITAEGGPLGKEPFTPMREGARLFFQYVNAEEGGICGRQVQFISCDDAENPERDKECARQLVEQQKVFAIVGNATDAYAAARYVSNSGVPDIGSIPIGNAYYKFPRLYSLYGASGYPRTGEYIGRKKGQDAELYALRGSYRWFKQRLGVKKAAVMYYNIPISRTAGLFIAEGLEKEGIEVVYHPNGGAGRDPVNPSWDTEAVNIKSSGADALWHAIDIAGHQKLCRSLDKFDYTLRASVATVQGLGQLVDSFSAPCKNTVFGTGSTPIYGETGHPEIAKIASALARFNPDRKMHQWIVDGWSAGMLFKKAVESMGDKPTRKGLIAWMDKQDGTETLGGFVEPGNLDWRTPPRGTDFTKPGQDCFSVGKWDPKAKTFKSALGGGKVFECRRTAYYSYVPQDDGS